MKMLVIDESANEWRNKKNKNWIQKSLAFGAVGCCAKRMCDGKREHKTIVKRLSVYTLSRCSSTTEQMLIVSSLWGIDTRIERGNGMFKRTRAKKKTTSHRRVKSKLNQANECVCVCNVCCCLHSNVGAMCPDNFVHFYVRRSAYFFSRSHKSNRNAAPLFA